MYVICNFIYLFDFFLIRQQSIYTSPISEAAESSPVDDISTESPELYAVQLSYPPEEPGTSRFLDQKVCIPKYEPLPGDFSMANPTSDSFVSPVESTITTSSSSSSSAFPLFASETTEPIKSEESHPWASGSDFNKPHEMTLEHYPILSTYEAVEPGDHNFSDFSLYDSFTFHGIADDNMTSIAENYI